MHSPDGTGGAPPGDDEVVVDIEVSENFSARYSIRGRPEAVIKVAEAIVPPVDPREHYRRKFFAAAHLFVFGVALLSVAGMVAHFLNLRKFNLMFLSGMGVWTVGSIIWLYLAIIRDVFGVRVPLRPPPN